MMRDTPVPPTDDSGYPGDAASLARLAVELDPSDHPRAVAV